jgi:hypothetical protein
MIGIISMDLMPENCVALFFGYSRKYLAFDTSQVCSHGSFNFLEIMYSSPCSVVIYFEVYGQSRLGMLMAISSIVGKCSSRLFTF